MTVIVTGLSLPTAIALALLLPIAIAAPLKVPKQLASTTAPKKGPSVVETWLQKAVDARYAKKDVRFKATAMEKLEKILDAPEENDVVDKAVEARLHMPDAPHLSHAANTRLRKKFALKLRQKIEERKERASRRYDSLDEANDSGEDSSNAEIHERSQEAKDVVDNDSTAEDGSNVNSDEIEQNEERSEKQASVEDDGNAEDSTNLNLDDLRQREEVSGAKQGATQAKHEAAGDGSNNLDPVASDSDEGSDAAFVQRLRSKKNRAKRAKFLDRSKAVDDGEDSSNGEEVSSSENLEGDRNDHEGHASEGEDDAMQEGSEEDSANVNEGGSQNQDRESTEDDDSNKFEGSSNSGDEDEAGDLNGSDDDSEGLALMQRPIRGEDAAKQWRLRKAHLAMKAKADKKKASGVDQRSVVFQLRNAAADLERSVQKYMHEDDEKTEAQTKVQRDLAQETAKMQQDVDHELSDAPEKKEGGAKLEEADAPEKSSEGDAPERAAEGDAPEKASKGDDAENVYDSCEDLCEMDKGPDQETCVTECRVFVDTNGEDALKDFVADETYNEQGGESMEKAFEEKYGEKVPDCEPTLDVSVVPTFASLDKDGDGKISRAEMEEWALSACVPNELTHQVFEMADTDFDEAVDEQEFAEVGEDLETAQILDRFADRHTKGEDQYEPVQAPEFDDIDENKDEKLDKDEIMKMFTAEIKKRIPNMRDRDVATVASQNEEAVMNDIEKLDTDKDGFLNREEYAARDPEDMGDELHELAQNPNNLPDPDDVHM